MLNGEDTEIDKTIADSISDTLCTLSGMNGPRYESEEERIQAGKNKG